MRRRILIVEDEPVLGRNLATTLQRLNIDSVLALSFAEGVKQIGEQAFDLVCADINLGDGSGLDLADHIKHSNPQLPVLIMTGQDSVHHRQRAERAKTPAFLAKPFALAQFRELVVSILDESAGRSGQASANPPGPRVMMYSHDTIGLGHMRRNSAIAAELVARVPGMSVLLVAGCPGGDVFSLPPGVDLIKLPTVTKIAREKWRPGSLRISAGELLSLRSGLIGQAVEQFKPDVFLVDHEPKGVWGELLPVFDQIARSASGPKLVLGLRDILDTPELVLRRWRESGTDQLIPSRYHAVLIYGDERVFPSAHAYGLSQMPGLKTQYCGYVSAGSTTRSSPKQKSPSVGRVLITGGEGRDAYPIMVAAMNALARIAPALRPSVTMVAGPLMDAELFSELSSKARKLNIHLLRSSNEMPALIAQSSLFITMGGYNSMVEAVASGVRTVVVPRLGPSAEQCLRSVLFDKLQLVSTVSMEGDPAAQLQAHFLSVNTGPVTVSPAAQKISLDGAQNAANVIIALIKAKATQHTSPASNPLAPGSGMHG